MKFTKLTLSLLFTLPLSSMAKTNITTSGISSGAYMAQQFHVAYSSEVSGVGIVAGGPYHCAKGSTVDALLKCMSITLGEPSLESSLQEAQKQEQANGIDPLKNIAKSKVYILSGTEDQTVVQKVAEVAVETYRSWGVDGASLVFENHIPVGHAFPTENFGNACEAGAQSPYISKCGRDIAGEILEHLIGKLSPKTTPKSNRLFSFDQRMGIAAEEFDRLSLQKTGYAYVPKGCENAMSAGCAVHVAFHGCKQTVDDIKDTYYTKTGYNEWAEANRIVVVYPQVKASPVGGNPNGCWDWWGYSGANYHTKNGPQMKAVYSMVKALMSGQISLSN